jgi:hypothetical protein
VRFTNSHCPAQFLNCDHLGFRLPDSSTDSRQPKPNNYSFGYWSPTRIYFLPYVGDHIPERVQFYLLRLRYIMLQGLTGSAAGFLQIVPLVVYYVKLFLLGSTPRSIYAIKYDLRDVAWGTLFPSITLISVIGKHILFKFVVLKLTMSDRYFLHDCRFSANCSSNGRLTLFSD